MIFIIKYDVMVTNLKREELSSMKHTLHGMLLSSGRIEEPDYESLAESLGTLSFKHYSLDSYANQLKEAIDEMLDLDDIGFDIGQLYQFQKKLS
jgi:hypothetical protein